MERRADITDFAISLYFGKRRTGSNRVPTHSSMQAFIAHVANPITDTSALAHFLCYANVDLSRFRLLSLGQIQGQHAMFELGGNVLLIYSIAQLELAEKIRQLIFPVKHLTRRAVRGSAPDGQQIVFHP
jgi:hypothetical protein